MGSLDDSHWLVNGVLYIRMERLDRIHAGHGRVAKPNR